MRTINVYTDSSRRVRLWDSRSESTSAKCSSFPFGIFNSIYGNDYPTIYVHFRHLVPEDKHDLDPAIVPMHTIILILFGHFEKATILILIILLLSCGKKEDPVYKGQSLIKYSIDQTIKA